MFGKCPFGKWFSGCVFQDLSFLVKGRFGKYPFGETHSVICLVILERLPLRFIVIYSSAVTVLSFANKVVKVQPHEFIRSSYAVPRCYNIFTPTRTHQLTHTRTNIHIPIPIRTQTYSHTYIHNTSFKLTIKLIPKNHTLTHILIWTHTHIHSYLHCSYSHSLFFKHTVTEHLFRYTYFFSYFHTDPYTHTGRWSSVASSPSFLNIDCLVSYW